MSSLDINSTTQLQSSWGISDEWHAREINALNLSAMHSIATLINIWNYYRKQRPTEQDIVSTSTAPTLHSLNSSGSGEKYHVSISNCPSSIRSTFLTFVNSSCSRRAVGSNDPWSSASVPASCSSNLRFWLRVLHPKWKTCHQHANCLMPTKVSHHTTKQFPQSLR